MELVLRRSCEEVRVARRMGLQGGGGCEEKRVARRSKW